MNDSITDESRRSPKLQRSIAKHQAEKVAVLNSNKKIDIISNCFECSYFSKGGWCGKSQRHIEWPNEEHTGFPEWCKLEGV